METDGSTSSPLIEAKEDAAEAAQDQANAQEVVAEVVTEAAEAAIERAEEREAAAEIVAVAVTDAAIADEKYRAVMELRERLEKCERETMERETATTAKFQTLETAMMELQTRLSTPPSIPPTLNPPPTMAESASADVLANPPSVTTEVIQETTDAPPSLPAAPADRRKRIRLL